MKFDNLAIILGAVAVAYVFYKGQKVRAAMESLSGYNDTQYNSGWGDNVTGNKVLTYV